MPKHNYNPSKPALCLQPKKQKKTTALSKQTFEQRIADSLKVDKMENFRIKDKPIFNTDSEKLMEKNRKTLKYKTFNLLKVFMTLAVGIFTNTLQSDEDINMYNLMYTIIYVYHHVLRVYVGDPTATGCYAIDFPTNVNYNDVKVAFLAAYKEAKDAMQSRKDRHIMTFENIYSAMGHAILHHREGCNYFDMCDALFDLINFLPWKSTATERHYECYYVTPENDTIRLTGVAKLSTEDGKVYVRSLAPHLLE